MASLISAVVCEKAVIHPNGYIDLLRLINQLVLTESSSQKDLDIESQSEPESEDDKEWLFDIFTHWSRSATNAPEQPIAKLRFLDPQSKPVLKDMLMTLPLETQKTTVVLARVTKKIRFKKSGTYSLKVMVSDANGRRFKTLATVPIEVVVVNADEA